MVLTDGEETCGGSPCDLSEKLYAEADQLTVNVVGLRVKNYAWIGIRVSSTPSALLKRTVANTSRVDTLAGLREALEKTLGCPMVTQASPIRHALPARRWWR